MRRVVLTSRFEKDVKRLKKRNFDMVKLRGAMRQLSTGQSLEENYRDHPLRGRHQGARECHILPDWLLIYRLAGDDEIEMIRTGTHVDLFE